MDALPRLNRLFLWIAKASALVFGVPLLLIISLLGKQQTKDLDYQERLKPSIDFVEDFYKSKHRLPSQEEFGKRGIDLITKDSADAAFKSNGGQKTNDYCVRIWRGERWTYYFSWKRSFDIVEPK